MTKSISQNEHDVVQLLFEHDSCTIYDLERYLNVTATAVRQRLNRLTAAGLVDRCTESEGRGRPIYKYWLTKAGRQTAGDNLADFAGAMWQEIQMIPDESIRKTIVSGTVKRLAEAYSDQLAGKSLEDRLQAIAKLFGDRNIPATVEQQAGLPVLKILSCPYPELSNDNHEVCEMEKQLLSQMVGGTFEMCQCRQDGDGCCTFQPTDRSDK